MPHVPIEQQFVLTLACPDAKGIVHAVSGLLDQAGCNDDFTAVGRDIESVVLTRAVRWHVEHRVLLNAWFSAETS